MNTDKHSFKVGEIYNRRKHIHAAYGGQERGGISTPTSAPLIFAFTSESGANFGYEDTFKPDGIFWYTGEGQVGDMQMLRGNAAIANHARNGKSILLFESTKSDQLRFLGEVECLGHHIEQRPDKNGSIRDAIIFHLGLLPPTLDNKAEATKKSYTTSGHLSSSLTLAELRLIALESVDSDAPPDQKLANIKRRSEAIKRYALLRSKGNCESCKQSAPFKSKTGPFLEVHHVSRLADGGPDHPAYVVALCPNCHRRAHYSVDSEKFNDSLIAWLTEHETR